jgi:hypothetical protein
MHLFCVALFIMTFPGPSVDTYATVIAGACPTPEDQNALAKSLQDATGAAIVHFRFEPVTIKTTPTKDA